MEIKVRVLFLGLALASFSWLFSPHSQAAESGDSRNEAVLICKKLLSSMSQRDCLTIVRDTDYFDSTALDACSQAIISSRAVECLKEIANKKYLPAEVEVCREKLADFSKIDCFKSTGRKMTVANPVLPTVASTFSSDEAALRELRAIEAMLRDHDGARALTKLGQLIRVYERKLGQTQSY